MSKKNGDKARFGKEQKKKLIRRKHTLEVRQSLANNIIGTTPTPTSKLTPSAQPGAEPIQTDLG